MAESDPLMYDTIQEFSGTSDMANPRTYTIGDTAIKLERYDPYGLIRMLWPEGKEPPQFKDANYTTFEEARKALDSYLNSIKSVNAS